VSFGDFTKRPPSNRTPESERTIRWREKHRVKYREYMKALMRKKRKEAREKREAEDSEGRENEERGK